MPGRPPKPTALKLLQGNPGKRPLPKGEPRPPVGCEPPANLTKRARGVWDRGDVSLALARMLHSYYIQFGGTPSSRARISVEPKKQESKLERFISGA